MKALYSTGDMVELVSSEDPDYNGVYEVVCALSCGDTFVWGDTEMTNRTGSAVYFLGQFEGGPVFWKESAVSLVSRKTVH